MSIAKFLGLVFAVTLLSPPVFVGFLLITLTILFTFNMDRVLQQTGQALLDSGNRPGFNFRPPSMPGSICVNGAILSLSLFALGIGWSANPKLAGAALETLSSCAFIVCHFLVLAIVLGSVHKFVKLVD